MDKKIITIWADKNNKHDWLQSASKIDCRNKTGFSKVGYYGYNIKVIGEFTYFYSENMWQQTVQTKVLTINIDSIKEK